jgi:hypothetical protein
VGLAVTESINTEGLLQVGEVTSRVLRDAQVEVDFTNVWIESAAAAYLDCQVFAQERIDAAGPYDDTRALVELVTWLGDKIREVHSKPSTGTVDA